jgi:hypothetical protein
MRQEQSSQAGLQRPQEQASIYYFTCTLIITLNFTLGEIEEKEKLWIKRSTVWETINDKGRINDVRT